MERRDFLKLTAASGLLFELGTASVELAFTFEV